MNPLQKAALWVPAIRRLRDARDALLAERAALLIQTASVEQEDRKARAAGIARTEGRLIVTEYSYHPHSRPIENGAGGRRLITRLQADEDRYAATLRSVAEHVALLANIPRTEAAGRPFWENDWFPPFDGASLYGLIVQSAPRRYIEVGSGMSTRFARQAISDLGLRTRIVSIDPHPHTAVDTLCDEVVRSRMEEVPRSFWEMIEPEDLLFVDNSHRSFPNSDVTVFFTEVLPALRQGTIWGMHDIFLPWDYPEHWRDRFYNEQYLLLAYLLGGADGDEIVLPVHWAASQPSLHGILASLWAHEDLFRNAGTNGGCFWMRRGAGAVT
jgi:predicted O-methyltransferase YrrM